jgi:UDP-N-acetylmuramoyl-tripeptide--D-alanyl-D-alanine ligase
LRLWKKINGREGSLRWLVRGMRRGWRIPVAVIWRGTLRPLHLVAVTGSGGKSTTVALLGNIFSAVGPTRIGVGFNTRYGVARSIIRARRSDRYWVQEVSGHEAGAVTLTARLLRHSVAVVTTIGTDHYKEFRSKEAIAEEKSALVAMLPPGGTAVLNADDPLVLEMAQKTNERVVTFGKSEAADIRVVDHCSRFPERLHLTVTDGNQTLPVRTRLIGERWITSVLAAIACGQALGIDLQTCIHAVEAQEPSHGKDSVHEIEDGPTIILDTVKAPLWTMQSSIDMVCDSTSLRRTMVFGTISDYAGSSSQKYRRIAHAALGVCDRVLFVGQSSERVARMLPDNKDRLFAFASTKEASDFLMATALAGELIYIKSSGIDHLERILYQWRAPIRCWVESCRKSFACDYCKQLYEHGRTRRTGFNPDAPANTGNGASAA